LRWMDRAVVAGCAKRTQAQILEPIPVQTELPVAITLMLALPKGNGFDEVVRYCTELGWLALPQ